MDNSLFKIDTQKHGFIRDKAAKFSRKNTICSCEAIVVYQDKIIDRFMVRYKVKPKRDSYNTYYRHKTIISSGIWGEFDGLVELPSFMYELSDEIEIKVEYFLRDKLEMPFIYKIVINNKYRYDSCKLRYDRNNKISILKNS